MIAKPASVCASRTRTIYLPRALDNHVYSALQRSIEDSRDEDLVVDATYLGVMESRLVALLRSAMLARNTDQHSLTVVRSSGGAVSMPVPVAELELPDAVSR